MMKGQINLSHSQPFKVELARGQKGTYAWTITVHAATPAQTVEQLYELDGQLKAQYAVQLPPTE